MQKKNILLSVVGIFAFAVMFSACQSTSTPVTTEPAPVEQVAPSATDPDEQTMNEQDDEDSEVDSVTTTATYESPAGPEQVGFTLMVDDEGDIAFSSVARVLLQQVAPKAAVAVGDVCQSSHGRQNIHHRSHARNATRCDQLGSVKQQGNVKGGESVLRPRGRKHRPRIASDPVVPDKDKKSILEVCRGTGGFDEFAERKIRVSKRIEFLDRLEAMLAQGVGRRMNIGEFA